MGNLDKIKKLDQEIEAPADFTSPEVLYNELIAAIRKYHPSDDISMIEKAYQIAYDAHKDQRRKSGEPYIIHPLCVAIILADLELDKETLVAGILHDVVEDTVMTEEEITAIFGEEVALLVDGVTKLTQISWTIDKVEIQAENLRKMFLAMAKDIRVILIKLADRLHNMRTLPRSRPSWMICLSNISSRRFTKNCPKNWRSVRTPGRRLSIRLWMKSRNIWTMRASKPR